VDGQMECLVKGPVCSQQIHIEHGGPGSRLEVKGADSSIKMDRELQSKVWANVTDGEAVMAIAGTYGLIPDVATTKTRHLEMKHSLVQRETDLRFIRRLARRNGCYFWISCLAPGIETAHFQRPDLDSQPAADIYINYNNPHIESLDIHWDAERPTSVEGKQLDLNTKKEVNGGVDQTPQKILGNKSLLDITGDTRSMHVTAPSDDAGNMQARSEGALIESDWFIRANCTTSLYRLGKLVRAHDIVNIIGAGSRHSGPYLVAGVRHIIDAATHLMEIELVRNGWQDGPGGLGGSLTRSFE
ncbi:MAG TPA: hypothetical protein PK228_09840, partial [Saprospiraceae bacterium]|nr:hypothetical protein [Saprospiraceae bacterium]